MIKKIYLHIGLHKTGSSSIQVSLAKSAEFLKQNGYLYPIFKARNDEIYNHSIPIYSLFAKKPENYHANISRDNINPEEIEKLHKKYIEQLRNQIISFKRENLIISGEDISGFNLIQLQNLKKFLIELVGEQAKIEVIVFVRNPVDAIQSRIQEGVKHGKVLDDILNNEQQITHKHFSRVFTHYLEVFKLEDIKIIRFEDAIKHEHGLVGCFLSNIGASKLVQKKIKYIYANKSISYEALILQSAINSQIPEFVNGANNPTRKGFIRRIIFEIPGQKIIFSEKLREKIWELAQADTLWINEKLQIKKYSFTQKVNNVKKTIWNTQTLCYLSRILLLQPHEIRSIICNEVFLELFRHYKNMSKEQIYHLILFLNSHKNNIAPEHKLPTVPKWKNFIYKTIGIKGLYINPYIFKILSTSKIKTKLNIIHSELNEQTLKSLIKYDNTFNLHSGKN